METRHLALKDFEFEQIDEFDTDEIQALDAGETSVGIATPSGVRVTLGSTCIQADLGEEADHYRDIAASEAVTALCDDTVYRLEGGVAVHQRTIPDAEAILAGPNSRFVTILCGKNRLVWLDPKEKLTQARVKSYDTDVPPLSPEISTAGNGWTVLRNGNKLYLYSESHEETSTCITVSLESFVSGGSVTDLAFVDEVLVIATTEGLVALDVSGDTVNHTWTEPDTVIDGLSPSARGVIYGWNEDTLYRITEKEAIECHGGGEYRSIQTTADHSLYVLDSDDSSRIVERAGETSVELSVEPVKYGAHTPLTLDIRNESATVLEYALDVEAEGIQFESSDQEATDQKGIEIRVPPLSETTCELGRVVADERVDTGVVTIYKASSGDTLARTDVPITYGTPELSVETRSQAIDHGDPVVELQMSNGGDGVAYVAPDEENLKRDAKTLRPGESGWVRVEGELESTKRWLYFTGADPSEEPRRIQVDLDAAIPASPCTSTSRAGPDGGTIQTTLRNRTEAEITETVGIETDGRTRLSGVVSIAPKSTIELWHPAPAEPADVLEVQIEGEGVIGPLVDQVATGIPVGVERRFYNTDGEEIAPEALPTGQQLEERLRLENQIDGTLTELTVSGDEEFRLESVAQNESVILSRDIVLLDRDQTVPSVSVGGSNEVTLPPIDTKDGLADLSLVAYANITDTAVDLSFRVTCPETLDGPVRLEELTVEGQQFSLERVECIFEPGDSFERQTIRQTNTDWSISIDDAPLTVEASFSGTDQRQTYNLRTLAPVNVSTSGPQLDPKIRRIRDGFIGNNKCELRLNPENPGEYTAFVEIRHRGDRLERESTRIGSNTKIIFPEKGRRLTLHVVGIGDQSFEQKYVFHRRMQTGWVSADSTEKPVSSSVPVVTPWKQREEDAD